MIIILFKWVFMAKYRFIGCEMINCGGGVVMHADHDIEFIDTKVTNCGNVFDIRDFKERKNVKPNNSTPFLLKDSEGFKISPIAIIVRHYLASAM